MMAVAPLTLRMRSLGLGLGWQWGRGGGTAGEGMARLEGFEPPTRGLEGRCSILLSYRRVWVGQASGPRRACSLVRLPQVIQSSSSSLGKARSQAPREMRKSESCFQPSSEMYLGM